MTLDIGYDLLQFQILHRYVTVLEHVLERHVATHPPIRLQPDLRAWAGGGPAGRSYALDEHTPRRTPPDAAWWPSRRAQRPAPLRPYVGHDNRLLHGRVLARVGMLVTGLDPEALEQLCDLTVRALAAYRTAVPVFVYDGREVEVLRRRGFTYEWVPPLERYEGRFEIHASWPEELERRLRFIADKWGFRHYIDLRGFGRASEKSRVPAPCDRDDEPATAP